MDFKVVRKMYDVEMGVYYYITVAFFSSMGFYSVDSMLRIPKDCLLLECDGTEHILSKYNLIGAQFDPNLEIR